MKPFLISLLALLLTACVDTNPNAGQSAASQMGLPAYASFQRNGHADSAALFFWRGNWWLYHPTMGSMKTIYDDPASIPKVAVLVIDGASGPISIKQTGFTDATPLPNGCLPRAISQAERFGGGIAIEPNHARFVP